MNGSWILLDCEECGKKTFTKFYWRVEVAIVGALFASVIPNTFGGVKFRGVRWQLKNFDIFSVLFEEIPQHFIFVVRRIVLDEINPLSLLIKGRDEVLLEKS